MTEHDYSATPKEMIFVGTGMAAAGLYTLLAGAAILPVPGGRDNLHAPLAIVLCIGLVLFLAGIAALLQGAGRANAHGELPKDAPYWMRVVQYVLMVTIFAAFGVLATWVALAGDERQFSGSFFDMSVTAATTRAAFAIGATIIWFCTLVVAVSGVRKLASSHRS